MSTRSRISILSPAEVFALSMTEGSLPERVVGEAHGYPILAPLPLTYEEALSEIEHDAFRALMESV